MRIFTDFSEFEDNFKIPGAIVALGTFDSIHLGHAKIISRIVELANNNSNSGTSVVFTFSNHPLSVIDGKKCPPLITSNEDKEKLIRNLGVNIFANMPFTKELLKMSPTDFINLLREKFDLKTIVIGDNFTYGHKGSGSAQTLKKAGVEYGFSVEVIDLVEMDNVPGNLAAVETVPVSSTAIRRFIQEGNVSAAACLLGRFFSLSGKVMDGDKRGRSLGFPTANIFAEEGLLFPADGVYAVRVLIDTAWYDAVANVGNNPTFSGLERKVEAHVLNFSGDLYGKTITVNFVERIRNEIAFASLEQLKSQIAKDIRIAKGKLMLLPI